ncbi:S4 domain-containing protein YaaA [Brochothrix thermosphacta]|uniref:S4 domain-containing protein YaaA n=1 Tax=Brochothrix thermosphacta TaxID=2756 RepID=UPI000D79A43F|nr:S4 domain-containing protein YaaA [Brochothrix thermosphacta]SPN74272.1 RNA binding protein involved in ribosome maturation [Brochothrix thermosphacta]
MEKVNINTEYITLGQMLKITDIISSGGMAKWFLSEHEINVNGEPDNRRGRKLYSNDKIEVIGFGEYQIFQAD